MNSVADMVKGGKKVHFVRYRKGHLYYVTECGFEFPVPIGDLGDASCHAQKKPCCSCATSASIATWC